MRSNQDSSNRENGYGLIITAFFEDYKVRNSDVRMRSRQYERLWLMLVTVLSGLIAWAMQHNIKAGELIFEPNSIILIIPPVILVWGVFMIYVLSCNRLLTLYVLKLEHEIKRLISPEGENSYEQFPMAWKSHHQQITQKSHKNLPHTFFGILFIILLAVVAAIFIASCYKSVVFLNTQQTNLGYIFGYIVAVMAIALSGLYYALQKRIKDYVQEKGFQTWQDNTS